MSTSIVLGIEISPSTICMGIVQQDGVVLSQQSFAPHTHTPMVEGILDHLDKILQQASCTKEQLEGIGISALSHAEQFFLGDALSNALDIPCEVTHTGNAAALAELQYGMADKWRNFISVSIDADLQCGIIANGELVTGANGLAGGLGHLLIKTPSGRERLVDYISEKGIKRATCRLVSERPGDSPLKKHSYKELTAQHVIEAAKAGDKIAIEVFQRLGEILGSKLADVVHHFSPDAFIFNSTLPALTDLLLPAAKEHLDECCLAIFRHKTQLVATELPSENISVLSASAIAWNMLAKSTTA